MAETFLYLTTTGRRTGQPHHIEIWYVEHDGCYYLCSEQRDRADWVRNLRRTPAVQFYVAARGQDISPRPASARVVSDEETTARVKALFDAKYGWSSGLFVVICAGEAGQGA